MSCINTTVAIPLLHSPLMLVGLSILTFLFFRLFSTNYARRVDGRSIKTSPPGPHRWAVPILGNLPQLMIMMRHRPLHQALWEMGKRYGPLMEIRMGAQRVLVASSPDAARLVLQTHDHIFSGRAPNIAASIVRSSDIAFSDPGPQWKLMRRTCITQLFAPKPLLAFRYFISSTNKALVERDISKCYRGLNFWQTFHYTLYASISVKFW